MIGEEKSLTTEFSCLERALTTTTTHEHKMERSVSSIVDVSYDDEHNALNSNDTSLASPQLQRQQTMQRLIEKLLHAVNCRTATCLNRSCSGYKRVIQHAKECKGNNGQCNICKQVIFICWYHAKSCIEQNCQVLFCTNFKLKILQQRTTMLQQYVMRSQSQDI